MLSWRASWTIALFAALFANAHPTYKADKRDAGRIISFPDPSTDNGLKQIPDANHPYMAPGPDDLRGPCPALNTLANHGYLPRTGVATPEQIFSAVTEGFNLGPRFAQFLISFATLARGNPELGLLSIGGESPDIPPPWGYFDGTAVGGIAKHGRFEGDLSISRNDANLGDSVNFQENIFDTLLDYVEQYGDLDGDGNKTIVTVEVMSKFKEAQFNIYQQWDPQFELHLARQLTVFSEVSLVLNAFANGIDNRTSATAMATIFRDQKFPPGFHRHAVPLELDIVAHTAGQVMDGISQTLLPGMNVDGRYVPDSPEFSDFLCDAIADIFAHNIPSTLASTTGILRQNVDTLTRAMFLPFQEVAGCSYMPLPGGVPGT